MGEISTQLSSLPSKHLYVKWGKKKVLSLKVDTFHQMRLMRHLRGGGGIHKSQAWATKGLEVLTSLEDIIQPCEEDGGRSGENGYGKQTRNGEDSWPSSVVPLEFHERNLSEVEAEWSEEGPAMHAQSKCLPFYRVAPDIRLKERRRISKIPMSPVGINAFRSDWIPVKERFLVIYEAST